MACPVSSSFARSSSPVLADVDAAYTEVEAQRLEDLHAEGAVHGTHRCCAERRLLESYKQQARRSGVPPHKTVAWVRRKLGGDVAVWRRTVDGVLGRAAPCVFCARELQRFDIRVHCPLDSSGAWFSGRVGDPGAPEPQLSGGQQRMLRHQGWLLCKPPQPPKERPPPPPPKLGTRWQRRKQQQEQQLQQQRQRLQKQQQQLG